MRETVILGVGMHKMGKFPEKSYADMASEAIGSALVDANMSWKDVQRMYAAHSYQGTGAASNVALALGFTGVPLYNIEAGCAGGLLALGMAYEAVGAGLCDVACAVGFEKMPKGILPADSFPTWLRKMGVALYPPLQAMLAQRYMKEYGVTREQLAKITIKAHNNGALCSYAHYPDCAGWSVEYVLNARMVAEPLTVVQVCPVSDGAAAAIVCAREKASRYRGSKTITIASFATKSDVVNTPYRTIDTDAASPVTRQCAREAYEKAGYGPKDMDVVECHDAYTICEMVDYQDLGLCPEGECGRLVDEGATEITGRIPVNTDGGMLARGNAIGATALASACELVWQLRGEAGPRQVDKPKIGLCSNLGIGPTACCAILKC